MSEANSNTSNRREATAAEAADWYARLRAADVSELDAARFRAWIAGDSARRREFEAIDELWDDLKAIERAPEVLRERAAIAARRAQSARRTSGRRRIFAWAAAAVAVLVLGTALWIQHRSVNSYVTDIGEQRTVPLPDGSVVTLNTATEIRLHFSPERRAVELVSGQANFEVAKNPARPFIVTAGDRAVRAVGTQFDVYKSGEKVTVTLIEGKVAVVPADSRLLSAGSATATLEEIVLTAGEQLSYRGKASASERKPVDVARVEAWRTRKLDFSDTPLEDAIAEANRYSATQIVLDAPELKNARISGRFDAGRNDLLVEGLQGYFHFHVEREADHRIVLTRKIH